MVEKISIDGVRIELDGDDIVAYGPKGVARFKSYTPERRSQMIPRDAYYIRDGQSQYDLGLLRERILGEVVQPVPDYPAAGHAVQLAPEAQWVWGDIRPGQIGIIDGVVGLRDSEVGITFNFSAFRGPGSAYSKDPTVCVSCSGGPGTIATPISEMVFTGDYIQVPFWRWRDTPQADGGENYLLKVPLWEWRPSNK